MHLFHDDAVCCCGRKRINCSLPSSSPGPAILSRRLWQVYLPMRDATFSHREVEDWLGESCVRHVSLRMTSRLPVHASTGRSAQRVGQSRSLLSVYGVPFMGSCPLSRLSSGSAAGCPGGTHELVWVLVVHPAAIWAADDADISCCHVEHVVQASRCRPNSSSIFTPLSRWSSLGGTCWLSLIGVWMSRR